MLKTHRLPAPAMPVLTPHDEYSLAHLIERHVDFVVTNKEGTQRSVAPDPILVRHYMKFRDSKLPVVTAIVTSPLVLADGTLLATQGLDRKRGIIFRLQPELVALLPDQADCTDTAVTDAMRLLTDEWLIDVATDYAGKCILIAAAISILERAVLAERPAFWVTAGQRGGGKTTTLQMVFIAATGYRAPAAAWSSSEEERRKCLFSYLSEGVPAVTWDNIPRGSVISCPSIEKSLTAYTYSDRVLGHTRTRTVPATTINFFTGNNIAPRGDLASRSLHVRLAVDRSDPENREFAHGDPIAWTNNHRGNILRALFTIIRGNPRLREDNPPPAETRFKGWWHLVGSAVEHAAQLHEAAAFPGDANWNQNCPPRKISFRTLFLDGETDEEQTSSLAIVLDVLREKWPSGCSARAIAAYAGAATEDAIEFKTALEQASGKAIRVVTATVMTWRLKALLDAPVRMADGVFVLRYVAGHEGGTFRVERLRPE
jgi:hypothetical protein